MAVLAVNPFQPENFHGTPEDVISPVIRSVWVGLEDVHGNSVDASYEASRAEMGVYLDNQVGSNDCLYWTGYHVVYGYTTWHTPVGYFDYDNPGFAWFNWGSGYDDFEIEVKRFTNPSSFTQGGPEQTTITFSGGDVWAFVVPSDGEKPDFAPLPGAPEDSGMEEGAYYVPVYYNTLRVAERRSINLETMDT